MTQLTRRARTTLTAWEWHRLLPSSMDEIREISRSCCARDRSRWDIGQEHIRTRAMQKPKTYNEARQGAQLLIKHLMLPPEKALRKPAGEPRRGRTRKDALKKRAPDVLVVQSEKRARVDDATDTMIENNASSLGRYRGSADEIREIPTILLGQNEKPIYMKNPLGRPFSSATAN